MGSDTGGGWAEGEWGRYGAVDGTAGKDGTIWGSGWGKSIVESAKSEKNYAAVGRACFGVQGFL